MTELERERLSRHLAEVIDDLSTAKMLRRAIENGCSTLHRCRSSGAGQAYDAARTAG
jgi:hypothetical protein